ncbi:unnamed protein product [Paramecium sonneborni]|uniref:WD40-repeat-containing domain n=1 Tax=Paramecium sonneborni TaxID=65129 RepID=A0A8S1RB62_9CILI|nr:unnamed protein product [Paramecium sonneborni]
MSSQDLNAIIQEPTSQNEKKSLIKENDFESNHKIEINKKLSAYLEKHWRNQKENQEKIENQLLILYQIKEEIQNFQEIILNSIQVYELTIKKYILILENNIKSQDINETDPEKSISFLKEKLNNDLSLFSTNNMIDSIQTKIYQLDNILITQNDSDEIKQQIASTKQNNLFNYQVIPKISCCSNIVINQSSKLIMIAQVDYLSVYEFKNEQVYEVSKFYSGHDDYITKIYSMKHQNQFLTYSFGFIQLWKKNIYGYWSCFQELSNINLNECLIVNDAEDQIILNSDNIIRFYVKSQIWILQSELNVHTEQICTMSLNSEENKLISSGYDNFICIFEKQDNNLWVLNQKISIQNCGKALCFITDNIFAFQSKTGKSIQIYRFNKQSQQFNYESETLVIGNSDQQEKILIYNPEKQILVNKTHNYINIIQVRKNGELHVGQSINFYTNQIGCTLSQDGEYLITLDNFTNGIQIRKHFQRKDNNHQ